MKTQTSTPETRWAKRSLHQQLLHKFLNDYGYERGPVVAHAIIADILTLVEQAYATDLPPRHVYWPAVAVANGATGKTPEIRDLVHVRLHLVTIMDGKNWTGKRPELRYNTGHAQTVHSPVQGSGGARNSERGENPQSVGC